MRPVVLVPPPPDYVPPPDPSGSLRGLVPMVDVATKAIWWVLPADDDK